MFHSTKAAIGEVGISEAEKPWLQCRVLTCSCHVLAGPDGLEPHKRYLHGHEQAQQVEGAVGYVDPAGAVWNTN